MENYALVVMCVDCEIVRHGVLERNVLMYAVEGRYGSPTGFVFECPRCGRKVALAHVEERFAKKIKVQKPKSTRKRRPTEAEES